MVSQVTRNDSIQKAYLNKLTNEYPYTGYKAKSESIYVKDGETASAIRSKYSSEPSCGPNGLRHDEPCTVVPGSLPKRRARDFFNELQKNGNCKLETIKDSNANWLAKLFGCDEMEVYSINLPKKDGKYPNLKYVMELTNLPKEAFVNISEEALKNPEKYILKGTLNIKAEYVNNLYN